MLILTSMNSSFSSSSPENCAGLGVANEGNVASSSLSSKAGCEAVVEVEVGMLKTEKEVWTRQITYWKGSEKAGGQLVQQWKEQTQ